MSVFGVLIAAVLIYILYVLVTYKRIPDNISAQVIQNVESNLVSTEKEYTIVTQNLGFGAYTKDFTFLWMAEKNRVQKAAKVS